MANAAALPRNALPILDLSGAHAIKWQGAGSGAAMLVELNREQWRVKQTDCSAQEVTMAKLFQLTGLPVPETALASPLSTQAGTAPGVASRFEETFYDLGKFLTTEHALARVGEKDPQAAQRYSALQLAHQDATAACSQLLAQAKVAQPWELPPELHAAHAKIDQARFNALEQMNRMLPLALRCEQLRHYVVSRWVANWDQLNYRMENFGYVMRNGEPVGMSLDFGACGPLGFRNMRTGAMMPKEASKDVAICQRPPSLFPMPPEFKIFAYKFDAMDCDPGPLHETERWPYGFQSETIAELIRPSVPLDSAVSDTLAEMGYRLSLIPDEAICAVTEMYWQPPAQARPNAWPAPSVLAVLLGERRDAMLKRVDSTQLGHWVQEDPERAQRVRTEMAKAMQPLIQASTDHDAERLIAARHEALLRTIERGAVPMLNSKHREIRSLQAFHNAVRQLREGLDAGNSKVISAAAAELMSPDVYQSLLQSLDFGPGYQPHTVAAFTANQDWLLLMRKLVQEQRVDANAVLALLMTPIEFAAYPASVGFHTADRPEVGMAFIQLLDALIEAPNGVTREVMRAQLLKAKQPGTANYFSALLQSDAAQGWINRLKASQLWPSSAEVSEHRSPHAANMFKVRSGMLKLRNAVLGSDTSLGETNFSVVRAKMELQQLVEEVDLAYCPAKQLLLESKLFRQDVLSKVTLVSYDELNSLDHAVTDAVGEAWRDALRKYPALRGVPVPASLLEQQQQEAARGYTEQMQADRHGPASTRIQGAWKRYEAQVLAQPQMTRSERGLAWKQCIEQAADEIGSMVSGREIPIVPQVETASIASQVHTHAARQASEAAAVQAAEQAQSQAQKQAAAQASQQAKQSAQSHAAEQAKKAVPSLAATAVAAHAQAAAAKAAQKHAADKAAHEAASRAARDAAISNSQFQDEVKTRLAMLRAPDAQGVASSSRQTTAQIAQRLTALQDDRLNAPLEARLRALRDAPAAAGASAGRTRSALREKK
ncbi:hypothetical protein IFT65_15990 [Stenotrophomonas sp. CFBP 13725]|nr:hypothetical protein [Stenotrophomonas sp. CFBP 13725]